MPITCQFRSAGVGICTRPAGHDTHRIESEEEKTAARVAAEAEVDFEQWLDAFKNALSGTAAAAEANDSDNSQKNRAVVIVGQADAIAAEAAWMIRERRAAAFARGALP